MISSFFLHTAPQKLRDCLSTIFEKVCEAIQTRAPLIEEGPDSYSYYKWPYLIEAARILTERKVDQIDAETLGLRLEPLFTKHGHRILELSTDRIVETYEYLMRLPEAQRQNLLSPSDITTHKTVPLQDNKDPCSRRQPPSLRVIRNG